MAISEENGTGMVMPVAPMGGYGYNNGGGLFGGGGDSWLGILFLIALLNGGWGGFGGFGGSWGMMGMGMMDGGFGLYPWLNNSQNINGGFRDQQLATQIGNIQNSVTSGFGDVQTTLCGGFAGVNQNISQTGNGIQNAVNQGFANTNLGMCQGFNGVNNSVFGAQTAISQQLNANELASLNRSFAEQTANTAGFTGVQAGIADLRYTEATENCATRTASAQNTRDIIDAQTRGTQAILDKLCALELDGVKNQLAQAQRENVGLQNQINMANFAASQVAQTAELRTAQATTANQLISELRSCPIPSQPVYGNQPIFTCGGNNGCGCGNNF